MNELEVTLVIAPRERFSFSERALATLYEHTTIPFRLIYVTGGAPDPVVQCLEKEKEQKGFELIHSDHYLSPNQARNIAVPMIKTKYGVFLDNDALVTPRWLENLVQCAEETDAWIVGPLYMIGEFERATIHMAGGRLREEVMDGKRFLIDHQYLYDTPIAKANMRLKRLECEYVEFHCMLIKTEMFEQTGLLDEKLLNLHEERDVCMTAAKAGHSVYIEPKSVVSYVPPPPCDWWDIPYFMLRWSEEWSVNSVRRFNEKWGIAGVRHISDDKGRHEEGTVIGFASTWRSRVAGLRISDKAPEIAAMRPLQQAQLMTAMLASVAREYFSVEAKTIEGEVAVSYDSVSTPRIVMGLAELPDEKFEYQISVFPHRRQNKFEPILIHIDDLSHKKAEVLGKHAFLVLQTSPYAYQCWFAANPASWESAVAGAGGSIDYVDSIDTAPTAMAGSLGKGGYRVRLVRGEVGKLLTDRELTNEKLESELVEGGVY